MTDLACPPAPPRDRVPVHLREPRHRSVGREVLLLGSLLLVYQATRLLGGRDVAGALQNGRDVLELEAGLGLASERRLQALVLDAQPLVEAANTYYVVAHLPVMVGALLWLLLSQPDLYRRTRSALIGATAAALAVYVLVPVAPPRMLPGFVDTAAVHGQSVYEHSTLVNELAALPSMHVGWAVLVALACASATRSRWRWLWAAHPVLTVLVVVVTANHYWVDALAGAAVVAAAWSVAGSTRWQQLATS